MRLPQKDSVREKVVLYILAHGTRTRSQITAEFPAVLRSTLANGLLSMVQEMGVLVKSDDDVFSVTPKAAKHYAQSGDEPHFVGEIVPPRTATPFKPLKALPWERHMDKIRTDISFKNGGTLFTYGWAV